MEVRFFHDVNNLVSLQFRYSKSKSFAYGQINSYNILIVAIRSVRLEKLHSEQLEQLNQL